MNYPKVLIIGETFRLNGGGGITMSNLFKDWPQECIAVITDHITETNPTTKYKYYQLGSEEIKFPFPFSLIQAHIQSGPYYFNSGNKVNVFVKNSQGLADQLKKKIRPIFDNSLSLMGLSSRFYSIKLSDSLRKWIQDFNPDIIYIQPFLHKTMRFGNSLYRTFGLPYAVHIMDDSIKYINKSVFLRRLHQRQIEQDFKQLIHNAKVLLSISEAMSIEYFRRYGKSFLHFRNPIEIDKWVPYQKSDLSVDSERLRIVYTGRLFSPTFYALIDLCTVIDGLNNNKKNVELHIYTHDENLTFKTITKKLMGVKICEPVDLDDMPRLISQYDIFFICLDFDRQAQNYSQFSISTRTSEGMISGVPILVYAPKSSALSLYFAKNVSGLIVGNKDIKLLGKAILTLWQDINCRQKLSTNAIKTALSDSNSINIRENFRRALTDAKDERVL